jgi:TRAP-type uncharacterized transport system substrate-binding protein
LVNDVEKIARASQDLLAVPDHYDPGIRYRLPVRSTRAPREITIATGDEKGAYHVFGLRYRDILARNGITLRVKSTAGSVENIKLLDGPET